MTVASSLVLSRKQKGPHAGAQKHSLETCIQLHMFGKGEAHNLMGL